MIALMLWLNARSLTLLVLFLGCVPVAQAHPHNWITLNSQFVLDADARLVQIKQRWEFDVYYSMMTLADMRNEYDDASEGMRSLAAQMVNNLAAHHYFSSLRVNDTDTPLGIPNDYGLTTVLKEGQEEDQEKGQDVLVLEMSFDLPRQPLLSGSALSWRVFDPTYYIAMMHMSESNVSVENASATACATELLIPEPSDELLGYAQSLDRSQTDTDGLGAHFAETVFIRCQ